MNMNNLLYVCIGYGHCLIPDNWVQSLKCSDCLGITRLEMQLTLHLMKELVIDVHVNIAAVTLCFHFHAFFSGSGCGWNDIVCYSMRNTIAIKRI